MTANLLLLPGLLCDAALWSAQCTALPQAGVKTFVADVTQDDHIDAMADRALALMPRRFALCGLSMGGYVALAIMRRAPDRVTRLCLMDTSARADTQAQSRNRRIIMGMASNHRFRGVTPRLLPTLLHPDHLSCETLCSAVTDMAERVGKDAFLRQQQAIIARPDSRPHLAAITVPTLVAVGSNDALTPPELSAEMAVLIPNARLRIIDQAGHLPPMEQPETVTAMLRDWLDGTR